MMRFFLSLFLCIPFFAFSQNLQQETFQRSSQDAREKLLTFCAGEWVSKAIYMATKLKISDLLKNEEKTIEELASLTNTCEDSLYRLLRTLSGFGIFSEVKRGVFANNDISLLLSQDQKGSLYNLTLFYGEEMHKAWEGFEEALFKGRPGFEIAYGKPVFRYFQENPDRQALFQKAMKEKTKAVTESSLSAYDFSPYKRIYDIGGGYGHFLDALVKEYSDVQALLFELPQVIATVENRNKRKELVAGDFFTKVPEGGDLYVLKSVLHDWDDKKAELILRNCHNAMGEKARLLIIEVVLLPEDQSQYANCMDLLMMNVTGGKERALKEFEKLLDNTGFSIEKLYPTGTEFSILEVKKSPISSCDNKRP